MVPQVTCGTISAAFKTISLSYLAPGSDGNVFQYATACSNEPAFGDIGFPLRYSKVTSSGAIIPALAPASIAILHTVMRDSIDNDVTASPANSITCPVPPAVPIFPIIARMTSFAVTPSGNSPSTVTRMFFAGFWSRV